MNLRNSYIIIATIFCGLFSLDNSQAQQTYTISNLTVNDGLAQSTVHSICQDKRGFLWFATYGGGVSKYDGVNFETFTAKDGLPGNKIYSIIEDSDGNIWIGGRDGLSIYDGFSFKRYTDTNGLSNNNIRCIKQGVNKDVWIATDGGGVMKYNGKSFLKYDIANGLASDNVYNIEILKNGNILFGTKEGINSFNGKRFTKFDSKNTHEEKIIGGILEYSENEIWYGSYGGGVCLVKNNKHQCFNLELDNHYQNITSMLKAKNGDVWIGSYGDGLYCVNKDTTFHFLMENSNISSNSILSIYQDKLGNIWVGTFLGGVCKINETAFYSLTEKNGLKDPSIETMFEYDNVIYLASMSGELNIYEDSKIKKYDSKNERNNSRITSFMIDNLGEFWMSTNGAGVFREKNGVMKNYSHKNSTFSSNQIFTMHQALDGSFWFGTYGDGIVRIKDDKIISYFKDFGRGKGLKSNHIFDIEEGENGELWFATNGGGLSKFDGRNFTSYTKEDGLLSNDFVSIQKDMFDNLWFASNGGGVVKYDGEKFISFNTKDGLISDNVNLILFDNANNLWVGTEKGINKIVFELKDSNVDDTTIIVKHLINNIEHYGVEDGLVGIETNRGAALKDNKGNLWFGTVKGVSIYNPNADNFNMKSPVAFIKKIRLGNKEVNWLDYADSITKWNNIPINLTLPYNNNNLSFEFVGINLNVPHGVKYRYILEGLEIEWNEEVSDHVSYSNLPPGDYIFKVLACNEDGMWHTEPTEFNFSINTPFWYKWWFISSLILIIVLTIYFTIKNREKKIRIRNLMLEKMVNDRTLELKKEKEKIEKINIEVETKNEQILDSIQYAKKIQLAILPPEELVREKLPDFAIFYEAKDIVSGDFYWMTEKEDIVYFAAVDCTGHGVPGAFMSIVGYRLLELIITGYNINEPAQALDELHMQVLETLHKQKGVAADISDGMDIALCAWNKKNRILKYSGAHNPLYLIRGGKLIEYPSDSRPIGMSMMKEFKNFHQHEIKIQKDDIIYIFTDGFADQFGGEKYRKYYYLTFQNFLLSICNEPMIKQQELLKEEFFRWKGNHNQIDDVLVFGVKF